MLTLNPTSNNHKALGVSAVKDRGEGGERDYGGKRETFFHCVYICVAERGESGDSSSGLCFFFLILPGRCISTEGDGFLFVLLRGTNDILGSGTRS